MNDIIEIPKNTALEVFTEENGLDPFIKQIESEIESFTPDLSTKKSRAVIASMAAKVRSSKAYLDGEGKKLVDELKEKPKLVDAERKRMRDHLDALAIKVRKPLTEWEETETARINGIKERIAMMQVIPQIETGSEVLKSHLSRLESTVIDDSFYELKGDAAIAKDKAISETKKNLEIAADREAEKAEFERLKKEAADREQKEREAKLIKEAEDRAKQEAEAKAQAEIDAAKADKEKARLAVLEAKEKQRIAEEEKKQAALDAENRIIEARQAEEKRIAAEVEAKRIEDEKRIADKSHRNKIIQEAVDSLVVCEMDRKSAESLINHIVNGKIKHVTINF